MQRADTFKVVECRQEGERERASGKEMDTERVCKVRGRRDIASFCCRTHMGMWKTVWRERGGRERDRERKRRGKR